MQVKLDLHFSENLNTFCGDYMTPLQNANRQNLAGKLKKENFCFSSIYM